ASSTASSCAASSFLRPCPRAKWGAGRPTSSPRRRPAGGRRGSSPRRAHAACVPASGFCPLCRPTGARARRSTLHRSWRGTRPAPSASRWSAAALAGPSNLSRRKSMRRYCRLWPPPRYRAVMWPLLLRPPVRRRGSTSDFSGVVFVISPKSDTERNRVAGVTGLNCRIPMSALEHLDRVALFQGHDRLLPRRPAAHVAAVALPLGSHHQGPHIRHGHLEQRLDGGADLRLGGLRLHPERVFLAGLERRRGLFGDHRPDDQVVLLRHPRPPASRSRRPAPAARRPPHPPTGSRTRWRRRTASHGPSAGCGPTGTRCARAPRRPSRPVPSYPPRPAC